MATKPLPSYSVASSQGGYLLQRDTLPFDTPAGIKLAVPSLDLANSIAEEWKKQLAKVVPSSMPMTQLAITTLDITARGREKAIEQILAYVDSELLCHRVETPVSLALRQQALWQPLLDWCQERFGAAFVTGTGIMPVRQQESTRQALRRVLDSYDDWSLTGLGCAVDSSGSLILSLALVEKQLSVEQVVQASELDAIFQMEQWGEDPAIMQRHEQVRQDLEIAAQWFRSLSSP